MGFFFKAGGGAGVSVHEESSYDGLATAAKTLDHAQLMRDTSTDFYYKNWKTGGPGIPVPVQYFDDVTGYASNGSGDFGYFTPSDSLADAVARGWSTIESNGGTVTKTAGNALTCSTTTAAGSLGAFQFDYQSAPYAADRVISLVVVESYAPSTAMSGSASKYEGSQFNTRANDGGTRYQLFCAFNHPTYTGQLNFGAEFTGGSLGDGDFQTFSSGGFYVITEITTARSLNVTQSLAKQRVASEPRSA